MQLLDRQTGATPPLRGESIHSDLPAGRIQLRLRANGELRTLPPGKATIGSSPRCNVRIQQPGVQPVHCLIVHGPEGLTVRRWAGETRLNGEPFVDAALSDGDCLALGGVELELLEEAIAPEAEAPEAGLAL